MEKIHETQHDVIVKVDDIKKGLYITVAALVGMGVFVWKQGVNENIERKAEIKQVMDHQTQQDLTIQDLSRGLHAIEEQQKDVRATLNLMQTAQQNSMIQLTEIRTQLSTTAEKVASTQNRVELMMTYLRNNSQIKPDVLDGTPSYKLQNYKP